MTSRNKDKKHHLDYDFENIDNPFFNNFGKKVLAVFIAVVLWFVANVEFDVEKSVSVKIKYNNLDPGLIITNKPPEDVNLRLQGPRSLLSTVSNSNVVINLDLEGISSGVSKFEIQEDQVNLPREVNVISISPSEITLNVDEKVTKTVNVKPNISLPDNGYRIVDEPVVNPEKVRITGPEIILSDLEKLETNPISIAGEKSRFSIQVPLQSPSPLVEIIGDELVRVTINIQEISLEKEFRDLQLTFRNFESLDYIINDDTTVDLVFEGPSSMINELRSNDIVTYIDANMLRSKEPGRYTLNIMVDYPNRDNIRLISKTPDKIDLTLK